MTEYQKLDASRFCEQAKELEDFLKSRVINQERAVNCIVASYDYYLSPLKKQEGPLLSALFLGPSGVGKTYFSELLAEYFFEDPKAFTKVECAGYQENHEIARLIGSPVGYIGYDHPSDTRYFNPPLLAQEKIDWPAVRYAQSKILRHDARAKELSTGIKRLEEQIREVDDAQTIEGLNRLLHGKIMELNQHVRNKIREQPLISIVLFDEFEKANPALYNFLLEATSKGTTTLSNGNQTSFYNSFIFMTSNIGSQTIARILSGKQNIGFLTPKTSEIAGDSIYKHVMVELKKYFNPEFLGRIEKDIVVFNPLLKSELIQIMNLRIVELLNGLERTYPVELIIDDAVKNFVLSKATDHPEYGARLIKSKIEKYLEEPLGRLINSQQILPGDRVFVELENNKTVFLKDPTVKGRDQDEIKKISDKIKRETKPKKTR